MRPKRMGRGVAQTLDDQLSEWTRIAGLKTDVPPATHLYSEDQK